MAASGRYARGSVVSALIMINLSAYTVRDVVATGSLPRHSTNTSLVQKRSRRAY